MLKYNYNWDTGVDYRSAYENGDFLKIEPHFGSIPVVFIEKKHQFV